MTVFNRIVAIIAAAVVFAVAAIALLVTAGTVSPDFLPVDWFEVPLERAADASGGTMAIIIVVSALLLLAALFVLFLEFFSRGRRQLLITSGEEGSASVDDGSVRLLAERAASGAGSVREVQCRVRERSNGLSISCRALAAMGSNIPEVSAEIQSRIKETVREFTGLPVADVKVTVKYERMDRKRAMVR